MLNWLIYTSKINFIEGTVRRWEGVKLTIKLYYIIKFNSEPDPFHYLKQYKMKKKLPLDRPSLYDINTLEFSKDSELNNFEYYMNREYAFNRDKGKCKICGVRLKAENRHCHRVKENISINEINKVSNLIWVCRNCDKYIHGKEFPIDSRINKIKIQKYRAKLD